MDSNGSDERKYRSTEEEKMERMETSHNSVKKCQKKKLKIEIN